MTRRKGADTLRLPTSKRGRGAYNDLRARMLADPPTSARIVDTIERNPDNLLLRITALTDNTRLTLADARTWLIEHGYLQVPLCSKCGVQLDPHRDYKMTLTEDGAVAECQDCEHI